MFLLSAFFFFLSHSPITSQSSLLNKLLDDLYSFLSSGSALGGFQNKTLRNPNFLRSVSCSDLICTCGWWERASECASCANSQGVRDRQLHRDPQGEDAVPTHQNATSTFPPVQSPTWRSRVMSVPNVDFHKYCSLTWGWTGTQNNVTQIYIQGFRRREVGWIKTIKKWYCVSCLQVVAWVEVNTNAASWVSQFCPSHWWIGHKHKWRVPARSMPHCSPHPGLCPSPWGLLTHLSKLQSASCWLFILELKFCQWLETLVSPNAKPR